MSSQELNQMEDLCYRGRESMRNWISTSSTEFLTLVYSITRDWMSVSDHADRASTFTFCSTVHWEYCACDAP